MNERTSAIPQERDIVGNGVISGLINVGGSARVYKIWVESLEMFRAVKIMDPDAGQEVRDRFRTEARISAKLSHPNIVQIYSFGETETGLPYIEMELISGLTLDAVIQNRGALPLPVALAVMISVLEAVHYAHNVSYTLYNQVHRGVMHRDIKPNNVIFSGGVPKLTDFGIARPVAVSLHTAQGSFVGTMRYMAPETCTGGETDFRSDIYQCGLLMYECLSGFIAYPQSDLDALMDAIKTGKRKPLDTHPKAAAVVKRCLELDPDKRYQTAQECLADVRALYNIQSPGISPDAQISAFIERTAPAAGKRPRDKSIAKMLKIAAAVIICSLLALALVIAGFRYGTDLLGMMIQPSPEGAKYASDGQSPSAATDTVPQSPSPERAKSVSDGQRPLTKGAKSDSPSKGQPAPNSSRATSPEGAQYASNGQRPLKAPDSSKTSPERAKYVSNGQRPLTERAKYVSNGQRPLTERAKSDTSDTKQPPAEDAQNLISEAKNLLAQGKPKEAHAIFQKALKTPSAVLTRQEIIKIAVYGSAECNTVLFREGKIPRANYETSWRSVQKAFPAGSAEYAEAEKRLNNGTAE